jgi:hypothetical protein
MQNPQFVSRSVVRTFAVAALGLLIIVTTLANLSFLWDPDGVAWTPEGELGLQVDYDGKVKAVAPDSPASQAGIIAGDRVDLFQTKLSSRGYVSGSPNRPRAGEHVPIWINHRGVDRIVDLVPVQSGLPLIPKVNLINRTIAALIFVIVGGVLVLLRPSWMTWGFYFYCLGFSPGIAFAGFSRFPSQAAHAANIIGGDILTAAGTVGILLFALHFMCDEFAAWRRMLERATPVLLVLFVVLIAYPDIANLILGLPAELAQRIMLALQGAVFALSIVAIFQTYIHGQPENRPRIQWVVLGLIVGVTGNYLADLLAFSSALPITVPRWFQSSLLLLNITLPLTVAYAVVRHRVFEVSFVVSRAIVYAIMTFVIIATFSLIEYFVGHELAAVRLAQITEIIVAIGMSFWFNRLEKQLEKLVDTVFFRRRSEAMHRLERDAGSVHRANERETVDRYLVDEAAEAFALSSAALFRTDDGVTYQRVLSSGWPRDAAASIPHDDRLVLTLEAEWEPLRLITIGWQRNDVPAGNSAPILAVPLLARRDLSAFVLYGPHANGADIDPEEVERLFRLCRAAQATYDDLRAERLNQEVTSLRDQLAKLQNGQPRAVEEAAQG